MQFLNPLMYDEYILGRAKAGSIFERLTFFDSNLHSLSDFQLAIVGLDEPSLTAFRNRFYALEDHFQLPICDLGLLKNDKNLEGNIEALKSSTNLIIIGGKPLSFQSTTAVVGQRLENKANERYISYQRHKSNLKDYNQADEFQNVSLGELRSNLRMVEPLLRECSQMIFNLNAIRMSDLGIEASNMVGITLEEASQITRYAGLSESMKCIQFPNLQPQFSFGNVTNEFGQSVSTMAWYYVEGILCLNYEDPAEDDHISYVVNTEYFEEPITFLKGEKSGKWWMKYGENDDYHPCMYEDFMQSRAGNIPDRLYKYCLS